MTRREFVTTTGAVVAAPVILSLQSCGGLNVTLDAITVAIDGFLALNLIPAISPVLAAQIETYLTQLTTAVESSATELSSSDTLAVKLSKIEGIFAAAIKPDLTGLAATVVNEINGIAKLVTDFLAAIGITPATPAVARAKALGTQATVTKAMISSSQAQKIILHAVATAAKVRAL